MNLSRIVQDISTSRTYKHFDMAYTDVPIEDSKKYLKCSFFFIF